MCREKRDYVPTEKYGWPYPLQSRQWLMLCRLQSGLPIKPGEMDRKTIKGPLADQSMWWHPWLEPDDPGDDWTENDRCTHHAPSNRDSDKKINHYIPTSIDHLTNPLLIKTAPMRMLAIKFTLRPITIAASPKVMDLST
jgi:hypothetical protein